MTVHTLSAPDVPTLLSLIDPAVELPCDVRKLPVEQRFPLWVQRNPTLVEHITRLALSAAHRGAKRISVKALFESVRASAAVDNGGPTPWKLDNSYSGPMGRYLVENHPELEGLIEIRRRSV